MKGTQSFAYGEDIQAPRGTRTMPYYFPVGHTAYNHVGADDNGNGVSTAGKLLGTVAVAAAAYHGYRRTGSIGWTIGWAVVGALFPIIAIPVAVAQGYGKKKGS